MTVRRAVHSGVHAWANLSRASWNAIGRETVAWRNLEFVPERIRPALGFAVRNCAACMVSLYFAFLLQLDQPYWAAMAVWMVAQPTPGMAISKSVYRIIGTLIGCVMGVMLIALFPQSPELFVLALAFWLGGCTLAANLLRNFRAYAAVLGGYTAAIVALGVVDTPDRAFHVAMARGAATIIGIICAGVITSLFAKHQAREKTVGRLREVLRVAATRASLPMTSTLPERVAVGKPFLTELIVLDAEIDFAAAESAEFRIHADLARSLLAHLFGASAARRSLEDHIQRVGLIQDAETLSLLDDAMTFFQNASSKSTSDALGTFEKEVEVLRGRIRKQSPEATPMDPAPAVSSRVVLDRLDDLLRHYGAAAHDWIGLAGEWKREPSLRLDFHRDHRIAWINGARAFLAIIAAGIFWIATAYSAGPLMLIQVGVACSLFSYAPRPDVVGKAFLQGILLATAAGFVCNFFLLQNVSGFPLLALILGAFLMPGAIAFLDPKWSGVGLSFCVNFVSICRPLNPMDYDIISFFNNAVAANVGFLFGMLTYKLFWPPDATAARRYVVHRIRRGLRIISQRNPAPPAWAWQTRMFDRVNRLHDPQNPSGTPTDHFFEGGLAALNLGNELLRLRELLEDAQLDAHTAPLAHRVLHSFREIIDEPDSTRFTIQAASAALQESTAPLEENAKRLWFRLQGVLEEMEAFFLEHSDFLKTGNPRGIA